MKRKFLIAVLIIALAATGFAQELKFNGNVNGGLGLLTSSERYQPSVLKAYGVDSESVGYRIRLDGSFTGESKTYGANVRIQARRENSITLPYYYGWLKFRDMITVKGGLVDDGTFGTGEWWIDDDLGEGLGLLTLINPVSGLTLGVGAYTAVQDGDANGIQGTSIPSSQYRFATKAYDAKYVFGATYTMPELVKVMATFRTKSYVDHSTVAKVQDYVDGIEPHSYAGYETRAFQSSVSVLAVPGLKAVVAARAENIQDYDIAGTLNFSETFEYKVNNDLTAGLDAVQMFFQELSGKDADDKRDPSLLFRLWGQYAVSSVIVPRLDLQYFINGTSRTTEIEGDSRWHRKAYSAKKPVYLGNDEWLKFSVFTVRPSVKFNLANNTFVEVGDAINLDSGTQKGAYADDSDPDKKSRISNVFYVDVRVTF